MWVYTCVCVCVCVCTIEEYRFSLECNNIYRRLKNLNKRNSNKDKTLIRYFTYFRTVLFFLFGGYNCNIYQEIRIKTGKSVQNTLVFVHIKENYMNSRSVLKLLVFIFTISLYFNYRKNNKIVTYCQIEIYSNNFTLKSLLERTQTVLIGLHLTDPVKCICSKNTSFNRIFQLLTLYKVNTTLWTVLSKNNFDPFTYNKLD